MKVKKSWLVINERCGVWFSDRLVADHLKIAEYYVQGGVKPTKITTIPYATEAVAKTDVRLLKPKAWLLAVLQPITNKIYSLLTFIVD
ncbi:MAG: hypothetical protein AAF383_15215 [Cyanobacteria bacterium P01_A01_bin.83]